MKPITPSSVLRESISVQRGENSLPSPCLSLSQLEELAPFVLKKRVGKDCETDNQFSQVRLIRDFLRDHPFSPIGADFLIHRASSFAS